ncbi:MAG: LicD family protein [Candidatus Adlerbacteria bacterium]|nr:LicD family protein [Candidatus Adlerbacteria bacterium]
MIRKFVKNVVRRVIPAFDRRVRRYEAAYAEYAEKKLRMRTDEELNLQGRGLKEIRDVFNDLSIPYYIFFGTLLGAVREGDFIRWDWDIGIAVKTEDVMPKQDLLHKALERAGFDVAEHISNKADFKINALKYGARYEIVGFFKLWNMRYRTGFRYPDAFFRGNTEVTLRGERYHTVENPEEFLVWMYGNWRTPIRSCNKSEYIKSKARTNHITQWMLKLVP